MKGILRCVVAASLAGALLMPGTVHARPLQVSLRQCMVSIALAGLTLGVLYNATRPPPRPRTSPSGGCYDCYETWSDDRFDRAVFHDRRTLRHEARRVAHYETHEKWKNAHAWEPARKYGDIIHAYRELPEVQRRLGRAGVPSTLASIEA